MTLDISISMAIVHQMILRYICAYFSILCKESLLGLLSYDQLKILYKNKYLNAPNEDGVLDSLESWISSNENFKLNAYEFDQDHLSNDNGKAYKELVDLSNNINWPILSL